MMDESAKRKRSLADLLRETPTPLAPTRLTLLLTQIETLAWGEYLQLAAPFELSSEGTQALTAKQIRDALQLAAVQNHLLRERIRLLTNPDAALLPMLKRVRAAKREQKPKDISPLRNWLKPMPVESEGEPVGYVQATGQNRRRITRFLKTLNAEPTGEIRSGKKGTPKKLYPVSVNLKVLDHWLGHWHTQEPDAKCRTILREVLWLAKCDAIPSDISRVRKILKRHLPAYSAKLVEYADMVELTLEPALRSDAGWSAFLKETAARSGEPGKQKAPEFSTGLFAPVPSQ